MTDGQNPRTISSFWKNLKRALISTPDLENGPSVCLQCELGVMDSNNFSNNLGGEAVIIPDRPIDDNAEIALKRQRLNIATDKTGPIEENSFMEIMKNLLSCSICLEVNTYSNQCQNGHLICMTCSGRLQQSIGELNCPVCRISLKQGLHRSLLAEQLTSELPASCRYCDSIMAVKCIKNHETNECNKRMVSCKYKMFGCSWIGVQENSNDHIETCSISNKTVGLLNDIATENFTKDIQSLQVPLQLWRALISRVKTQAMGSRMLIRQTTLNKSISANADQIIFKSPIIRVPFTCCNLHGFYIDIFVAKSEENGSEKLQYLLRSEHRTKLCLNFYLVSMKINEFINLDVQDSLHSHYFESNHKESCIHEFKLLSMDCDKDVPKISNLDSLFAEICFISERERSEKGHGLLSSNEEDESNPFMNNGSDSNVVFTLFSPTTSASRSMNTSNAMVSGTEEANAMNEVEQSHEEDIVITVTDNVDSADDISTENRDNFSMRNNHSFVAVPSVFLNPATQIFSYSPFQIDNSFMNNNFQQTPRLPRENIPYEQPVQQQIQQEISQMLVSDPEMVRFQSIGGSRNPNIGINEQVVQQDLNRSMREPIHMSLFYPQQTVVSPYITSSVSPLEIHPSAPRNILIRPRQIPNPLPFRQVHIFTNSDEINVLNYDHTSSPSSETIYTNSLNGNNELHSGDQNYTSPFSYQLISTEETISAEGIEH